MSFEYQQEGVEFLRRHPRAYLGDEPGLGKSRQSLLAAEGRTLVVAPAMVLDSGTWEDEAAKWRPDLDVTTYAYSSLNERVPTGKKFGYKPTDRLKPELRGHWDTVIFDEVHYVKGRKTSWTKASFKLEFDRGILMSGTPIPNWAHELFTALQHLFPAEAKPGRRLGSYWRWAEHWFDVTTSRWDPNARNVEGLRACGPECELGYGVACEHWRQFHDENFDGLFLQRKRDDVLTDLPELTKVDVKCPMGPAQKRLYKQLKKDFVAWTESGHEVVAWNSAALNVKLAKLVTGVEILDPTSTGSGKLDALGERIRDQAQPSLVLAHFKDSMAAAAAKAREVGKSAVVVDGDTSRGNRRAYCRAFQAGEVDVMVGSLAVISEGLTLTRADTVHFLERAYRPSRNEQALRRVHRIGQDRPVTAYYYLTDDTIDVRLGALLATKTDEQMKALPTRELAALL